MPRLELPGGAYSARSVIANCQRCVNLYPEANAAGAPTKITHYQRSGLKPLATPATPGFGRLVYRCSNGNGYAVIGQGVYSIGSAAAGWQLTLLGQLLVISNSPCSMSDNGISAILVDNSDIGYTINLATNVFAQLVDASGTFAGATKIDYIDTFFLWNFPGTNQFGSSLSNEVAFDNLYIAAKTDYPDPLMTLIVNRHEILLIGQLKTEIWYDAGLPTFPFAELPGAYHEHGTIAPYSVASQDISVYWLGQDLQGSGMVFRARGYECRRISNHALEFQIRKMKSAGTIADAIGYTYQLDGHVWYVLCFPTGDQTWAFDESTNEWSQRAWTDADGVLHRDRTNGAAFINGVNVAIDWQYGTIYQIDPETYTDTVNGITYSISFIRTFPHIVDVDLSFGQPGLTRPVSLDGKRVQFQSFAADLECGNGPLDANGDPALVTLRWSDDKGKTFQQDQLQSSGAPGEWLTQPLWRGLGIARDRIFELEYNIAGEAALNGAWVVGTLAVS